MKYHRVSAMVARHLYLYRRSLPRIMSLITALKVGPPASRVTDIRVEWVTATGRHTDFAIWY